jgi:hypothetical protein
MKSLVIVMSLRLVRANSFVWARNYSLLCLRMDPRVNHIASNPAQSRIGLRSTMRT